MIILNWLDGWRGHKLEKSILWNNCGLIVGTLPGFDITTLAILDALYLPTGCLILKRVILDGSEGFNNFLELWWLVASGGLGIWASSTSFQKSIIGWPQQPPNERVPDTSKKLDSWWSIPQKGTDFDNLGARDDLTIRISNFFDEMRLSRSLRPLRLLRL